MADTSMSAGVRLIRTPTPQSRFEAGVKVALVCAALVSVLTTICIVGSLLFETISFFGEVPVADFLFGTKWSPTFAGEQASFGVLPLLWGTIYLSLIALVVAIPLGLLGAIYLSEYAPPRVRKTIKPVLELLAGVPTIVFGYFALTFFTPTILQGPRDRRRRLQRALRGPDHGPAGAADDRLDRRGRDVRGAACRCARARSASAPTACRSRCGSSSRRRSRASSPRSCSARPARSARRCWCSSPAASRRTSGINPTESYQTMAAFIASIARGDIPTGSIEYKTIFAVGFLLFLLTFILNLISIRLVRKYRQVYE